MREKIMGIYCIENIINGKKYIGQSVDVEIRYKNHLSTLRNNHNDNKYLQKDWNDQKESDFKFYLIQECPKEQLNDVEMEVIEYYNVTNKDFGYNLNYGGLGSPGYKHEAEGLKKITENRIYATGKDHAFFGIHHSEETKEKLRKLNVGKQYALGTKRTDEQRKSLSIARTGSRVKNKSSNASSSYYGVYYAKKDKEWVANIRIIKTIRIGGYKTEEEAAKAYDKYVIEHNLENERLLNFPEDYG